MTERDRGPIVVSTGAGHRRDVPPPPAVETGLVCAGCGALAPAHRPFTPRCPNRRPGDDIDHVMARGIDLNRLDPPADPDPNPFVRYRALFHAYHVARAAGWGDARYVDLVRRARRRVAGVDGRGFRITPLVRAPAIARAAGLGPEGTVWVKDETGNVAGSHKARHLFGILLELRVAEALGDGDPARPLAIASCGNAALAAAVRRPGGRAASCACSSPPSADAAVVDRLRDLGRRRRHLPAPPGRGGRSVVPPAAGGPRRGRRPVHLPGPRQRPRDRGRRDAGVGDRRRAARRRWHPGPDRRPGRRRGARIGDRARASTMRRPSAPSTPSRAWTRSRPAAAAPLARAWERVLEDLGRGRRHAGRPRRASTTASGASRTGARATCGRGRRNPRASPTGSWTTRPTTGSRSCGRCSSPAGARSSWTSRPCSRPTRSPARPPASMRTRPAPRASRGCSPSPAAGSCGRTRSVAVILSGVRRAPVDQPTGAVTEEGR